MMIRRASWESARAMLTTCLAAGGSRPTSAVGADLPVAEPGEQLAGGPVGLPPWLTKPSRRCSWPRKMFSATLSPSTRSSSW